MCYSGVPPLNYSLPYFMFLLILNSFHKTSKLNFGAFQSMVSKW